jgi:hypothetical protein
VAANVIRIAEARRLHFVRMLDLVDEQPSAVLEVLIEYSKTGNGYRKSRRDIRQVLAQYGEIALHESRNRERRLFHGITRSGSAIGGQPYAIVIVDDVYNLAKLRQRQNAMGAILITAHPDAKILERASATGVTLIKKPFQQAVLLDCIHRLLF